MVYLNINDFTISYKIKDEQNESSILYNQKNNIFCHIINDITTDSKLNDNVISESNNEIKSNVLLTGSNHPGAKIVSFSHYCKEF